MKKICWLWLLLLIGSALWAEIQLEYRWENHNEEGIRNYFSSFYYTRWHNWRLQNRLYVKSSENLDAKETDYQRNILRNVFFVSRTMRNFAVSGYIGGEYAFNDNFATHMIGVNRTFDLQQGLLTGLQANWAYREWMLQIAADYAAREYELGKGIMQMAPIDDETQNEADLWLRTRLSYKMDGPWRAFWHWDRFHDMNDNDDYNYSTQELGMEWARKLGVEHFVQESVSLGTSDLPQKDAERYYVKSQLRWVSKMAHHWMSLYRISLINWTDKDFSEWYQPLGFGEVVIQRNFRFDDQNRVARFQTGMRYYWLDDALQWKSQWQDVFWRFTANVQTKFTWRRLAEMQQSYQGSLAIPLWKNHLRTSYHVEYKDNQEDDHQLIHQMRLSVFF